MPTNLLHLYYIVFRTNEIVINVTQTYEDCTTMASRYCWSYHVYTFFTLLLCHERRGTVAIYKTNWVSFIVPHCRVICCRLIEWSLVADCEISLQFQFWIRSDGSRWVLIRFLMLWCGRVTLSSSELHDPNDRWDADTFVLTTLSGISWWFDLELIENNYCHASERPVQCIVLYQ